MSEPDETVRFIAMKELMFLFGNVSRDTIDRKFAEGRMRRIKQGTYTYARSDDVKAEIRRVTEESEAIEQGRHQAA